MGRGGNGGENPGFRPRKRRSFRRSRVIEKSESLIDAAAEDEVMREGEAMLASGLPTIGQRQISLHWSEQDQRWMLHHHLGDGLEPIVMPLEARQRRDQMAAMRAALDEVLPFAPKVVDELAFDRQQQAVFWSRTAGEYRFWSPCSDCGGCSLTLPLASQDFDQLARLLAYRLSQSFASSEQEVDCFSCVANQIKSGDITLPAQPTIWYDPNPAGQDWMVWAPFTGEETTGEGISLPLGIRHFLAAPEEIRQAVEQTLGIGGHG